MARIAIVLNTSWNVWNFRLPLLQALAEDGHQVEVIAPRDNYTDKIPFPCHHIDISSSSLNPLMDMKFTFQLWRMFRRIRPDIVLLYTSKPNIYGNLAAAPLGIFTLSNISGLGAAFINGGWVKRVVVLLYKASLSSANVVFFQNEDDLAEFTDQGLVTGDKTRLVPGSGVDVNHFKPGTRRYSQDGEKVVFLLPARLLWDKGVREFVESGKDLIGQGYRAEFHLLGALDSDNPSAISRSEIDELCGLPGFVYRGFADDMALEYSSADCVVLPSYREGTPRALLEASSMALPIITTDVPGCRNVVDHGTTGFLCQVRNSDSLSAAMISMIEAGASGRKEMGLRGRSKIVAAFSQERVIEIYGEEVGKLLAG